MGDLGGEEDSAEVKSNLCVQSTLGEGKQVLSVNQLLTLKSRSSVSSLLCHFGIKEKSMPESTPQPRSSDAILGGQTPPPVTGAVLGGLEGAKQRFESETVATRLTALREAVQYGEQGIELAIQALSDESEQVKQLACRLLRQGNQRGKQALLDHQPLSYFTTLADWRFETYNPQVGITDPENNAYVVRMTNSGRSSRSGQEPVYDLSQFEALTQDPRAAELQALVFQMDRCDGYEVDNHTFDIAQQAICAAQDRFPQLKALFVGDSQDDHSYQFRFRKSYICVSDIRPFLSAFPKLEVLQIFGRFRAEEYFGDCTILQCAGLRHEHLKSLIIETADISPVNIEQLCSINLPELEYFELWIGRSCIHGSAVKPLAPILTGNTYPKLKYLGLCSSEEAGILVQKVIESPIMEKLVVLDLKMGTLSDFVILDMSGNSVNQVELLLNNAATSKLKVLNVTGNYISPHTMAQLSQQSYQVISDYQVRHEEDGRYYDEEDSDDYDEDESYNARQRSRHYALYE
jgi:hypothetical protein